MTEQSKLSPEILSLGRALIVQLYDENGRQDDLLSKWMAHDIAAKITAAEADPSNADAQTSCAEAILRLWEHRAVYPHPKRPMDSYEGIIQTLERLDPTSEDQFYLADRAKVTGEAGEWLEAARSIDGAARTLLTYVLKEAAHRTDKPIDWSELARATGLGEKADMQLLRIMIRSSDNPELSETELERIRLKQLLTNLAQFRKKAKLVEAELKADLQELESLKRDQQKAEGSEKTRR